MKWLNKYQLRKKCESGNSAYKVIKIVVYALINLLTNYWINYVVNKQLNFTGTCKLAGFIYFFLPTSTKTCKKNLPSIGKYDSSKNYCDG